MKFDHATPKILAQRIVYLAWQACGGTFGMGFLQSKPDATEADVWASAYGGTDYNESFRKMARLAPTEARCDYVLGRMMKFDIGWDDGSVTVTAGDPPTPDYQAWCKTYPTAEALVAAAVASLTTDEAERITP